MPLRKQATRSSKRKTTSFCTQAESNIEETAVLQTSTPVVKRRRTTRSSLTVTCSEPAGYVPNGSVSANASSSLSRASSVAHDLETPATAVSTSSGSYSSTKLLNEATAKVLATSSTFPTRAHRGMRVDEEALVDSLEEDDEEDLDEEFMPSESEGDGDFTEENVKSRPRSVKRAAPLSSRVTTIARSSSNGNTFRNVSDALGGSLDEEYGNLAEFPTEEEDVDNDVSDHDAGNEELSLPEFRDTSNRYRGGRRSGVKYTRAQRERMQLHSYHPKLRTIWGDLEKREKIPVAKDTQPPGLSLTLLPFQLEGLYWLRKQEQTEFRGGILADEMGMGKTIQTIALLMAEPRKKPNLVVAPTVALMQWKNEIDKYTGGVLKVAMFHGQNRDSDCKSLAENDVVMTTYSVVESTFRKQQHGHKKKDGVVIKAPSALHHINFHRIILDEGHSIKDRSCNTARAVFALKTKYKLVLTGTPLQNRIGEFFSLLRFLEIDPFSYYYCRRCPCKSLHWKFSDNRHCDNCKHRPMEHSCWFNMELLKPIQAHGNQGEGREAFEKLRKLLGHIMLRRTKLERADDLGLPPRIVRVRRDYFNEEELDLYDSIYGESKRRFNTYVAQGVVLNNYANIFTLITRMRQLADHPDLVLRRHAQEGQNILVCCICDDEAEDAIQSKCHHKFCRVCVTKYIDSYTGTGSPDCPHCHIPLSVDLSQPAIEEVPNNSKGSIINRIDMSNWRSSTKIEALVEELYKLRSKTNTIKSIVFSQFTSMLHLVEWRLHRGGFKTVMLEGSMSPTQRDAVIRHFMENTEVEVFLVSLKAGGIALNLTEASQVFILDPWWNPSVEWQSGDRVHRIGQKRPCRITRLVIEDSIESRIIELQEKKARMIQATVGGDQKSMEKLSPADMQFLFAN